MIEPILIQESKRQIIEFDLSNTLPEPELPSLNLSLTLHEHSRCGKVWFKGDLTHDNLRSLSVILEDIVFKLAAMESIP